MCTQSTVEMVRFQGLSLSQLSSLWGPFSTVLRGWPKNASKIRGTPWGRTPFGRYRFLAVKAQNACKAQVCSMFKSQKSFRNPLPFKKLHPPRKGFFRSGSSTVGRPKWTKMGLLRPKWSILVHSSFQRAENGPRMRNSTTTDPTTHSRPSDNCGLANTKIQFEIRQF